MRLTLRYFNALSPFTLALACACACARILIFTDSFLNKSGKGEGKKERRNRKELFCGHGQRHGHRHGQGLTSTGNAPNLADIAYNDGFSFGSLAGAASGIAITCFAGPIAGTAAACATAYGVGYFLARRMQILHR